MGENFTLLITSEQLKPLLGSENLRIFDCRHQLSDSSHGARVYGEGHIPGAAFAHLDDDLSSPVGPTTGRHPLPDWSVFCQWLGAKGVDAKTRVVVYDDVGGAFAARLWWMLQVLGHKQVAVLDGGFPAWVAAGGPVETQVPTFAPVVFSGKPDLSRYVSLEEMQTVYNQPRTVMIDARGAPRYRGETEPLDPKAGHIPGALNLPFTENLGADNTFLPPEKLKAKYQSMLGGTPPEQAIHYCGSGVSACHNLLAQEVAGLRSARLFVGSWSQWCADDSRPVETGSGNNEQEG